MVMKHPVLRLQTYLLGHRRNMVIKLCTEGSVQCSLTTVSELTKKEWPSSLLLNRFCPRAAFRQ